MCECGAGGIGCPSNVVVELSRRAFLGQSALVVGAAFLAGCGVGSDLTAPSTVNFSFKVADYSSLATVGGIALVDAGTPLAVVRTAADAFVALSRICPHAGATINTSGAGFQCPRHGARFDATGHWTGGQQTSSMHSYPTSYDPATGTVTIS